LSKFALVDGYSLVFRAYHALPVELATSKGERTNAVMGFCTMLLQVLARESPATVGVAFDVGRAFRHDEFADYKAHRPGMPDELKGQIDRVKEVVHRFGFARYEMPGYEADDVIGSLARALEAEGHEAVIVTGDTDLLQLVTDRVHAATPNQGRFSDVKLYDPPAVMERYGFAPAYIADYKALVGDSSDNIPGVPGVGAKTAKTLITSFGHVEEILARLDEVKPDRIRKALEEHAEQLRQSKRLTTIVTDLDVDTRKLKDAPHSYDRNSVIQLFQELEFRSLLSRLPEVQPNPSQDGQALATSADVPEVVTSYSTLRTPEEVREVVQRCMGAEMLAFDTETDRKGAVGAGLVGLSFSCEPGVAYYVPLGHEDYLSDADALLAEVRPLLEASGPSKTAHNAKFDYMVMRQHGIDLAPIVFDTSLAAFLLNETSVGLKDLAWTRLGVEMTPIETLLGRGKSQRNMAEVPVEEAAPYACADADVALRLYHVFKPELEQRGQLELLETLEVPLVPVLGDMELAGISIDTGALQILSRELYQELQALEESIKDLAGYEFNLGSPQQLSKLLFTDLGLKGGRRTTKGYSTDVHALEALSGKHPIIDQILQYRQLSKLKNTYVDALPLLVNPSTGRVHTSFNQTVASTGRLSSSDPNLQNIPVRTPLGRKVRNAFIASDSPANAIMPGPTVLLSVDYSQIELRILAHLTGEERLREAFERDEDIHRLTASQLYGAPLEEVTEEQRRTGKTINFGIIYGMTGFRLARDTGLNPAVAQDFVRKYNEQFPRIRALFDETLRKAEQNGYVQTESGRRRYLPDLLSSNVQRREAARRAAINMPIQGMAADIIKQAMIDISAELPRRGLRARMLLQVHDELLFEVPEAELDAAARLVMSLMESAVQLTVPLRAEAKWGRCWGEMAALEAAAVD
jgi:DNA polymerase-1